MPVAQATVLYINPPKPGGKKGTIKTDTIGLVGVWPNQLDQFQRGQVYTIEFKENNFNGKTYKDFVRFAAPQNNGGYQYQQEAPPPPSQSAPPRQAPAPAARRELTATDSAAKSIFVTGCVGRAMQSGEFRATDILDLTLRAAEAFEVAFNGAIPSTLAAEDEPNGQYDRDMNDKIPF